MQLFRRHHLFIVIRCIVNFLHVFGKEFLAEPPVDIIHDGFRHREFGIVRESRRFKPHVAELIDERFQRHAILQRHRSQNRHCVHQPGDNRALLVHAEENFARLSIIVEADVDVTFVSTDAELVRDSISLVRQPLPNWPFSRDIDNLTLQCLRGVTLGGILLAAGRERLTALAAIAIDGEAFHTTLPRLNIQHLNVVHGCIVRDVHRLGNRTGDERLHRRHQQERCYLFDIPSPVLAGLNGAIENRIVCLRQMRRAFNGAAATDNLLRRRNFTRTIADGGEEAKVRFGCLFRADFKSL